MWIMNIDQQLEIIKNHQKQTPVHVLPIADDLGIDVFKAKNWPDDLSGMIKKDSQSPLKYSIYVNADHHTNRRRFTIAHELAHLILHRGLIGDGITDDALYRSGLSNKVEAQANRLAADILMPWHLLDVYLTNGISDIQTLAEQFNVSQSAMSIRLGVPYEK